MFEKVINCFMVFVMVVVMICLMAIAWAMWSPLIDYKRNMTEVSKVLQNHAKIIDQHSQLIVSSRSPAIAPIKIKK